MTALLPETALTIGLLEMALTGGLLDAGASTSVFGDWLPEQRAVAEQLGREAAGIAPPFVLACTSNCSIVSLPPELNNSRHAYMVYTDSIKPLQLTRAMYMPFTKDRTALGEKDKSPEQQS